MRSDSLLSILLSLSGGDSAIRATAQSSAKPAVMPEPDLGSWMSRIRVDDGRSDRVDAMAWRGLDARKRVSCAPESPTARLSPEAIGHEYESDAEYTDPFQLTGIVLDPDVD